MQPKSNARFLGNIISEPLRIATFNLKDQNPFDYQSSVPLGDMFEDGEMIEDKDAQAQCEAEETEIRKLTA